MKIKVIVIQKRGSIYVEEIDALRIEVSGTDVKIYTSTSPAVSTSWASSDYMFAIKAVE